MEISEQKLIEIRSLEQEEDFTEEKAQYRKQMKKIVQEMFPIIENFPKSLEKFLEAHSRLESVMLLRVENQEELSKLEAERNEYDNQLNLLKTAEEERTFINVF